MIVTAVDPTGAAVVGVDLHTYDWGLLDDSYIWHARTNEQGVATLTSLPRWLKQIQLIAKHPKFEKSEIDVFLKGRQSTRVELHLKPAGLLRVHVTDERGEIPPGSVAIKAYTPRLPELRGGYLESGPISTDGVVVFGGIPQGLAIDLQVYQDLQPVAFRTGVEVGVDSDRQIEITIPVTVAVGFELTDEAGQGLSGEINLKSSEGLSTPVPIGSWEDMGLRYAASSELGQTAPLYVRAGHYHVSVKLDTGLYEEAPDLTLLSSRTVRLTIHGDRTLGGRLTDGSGRPLGGELIRLSEFPLAPFTFTDVDGRFSFEKLGEGFEHGFGNLQILDPIIGLVTLRSHVAPGSDFDLVYRRLLLRGRVPVFDEAGYRTASIRALSTAWSFGHGNDPRDYRPPMTDAEGRFELRLPAGTYKLSASNKNLVSTEVSIVLAKGAATPHVELVLFRPAWLKLDVDAAAGPATKLAVSVQGKTDLWSHEYDLPVNVMQRSLWRARIPAGMVAYQLLDTKGNLVGKGEILLRVGEMRALSR